MSQAIQQHIQGWFEGDEGLFKKVFDHYYPRLFAFAHRSARSREIAEELAMNVLLKIWQRKENISAVRDFEKYLFGMLRNEIATSYRKKFLAAEALENVPLQVLGTAEQPLYIKELETLYLAALEKLPPRSREIFLMSREQGMSHQEIARAENISVATVNNHISLSLSRLRTELEDYSGSALMILLFMDKF